MPLMRLRGIPLKRPGSVRKNTPGEELPAPTTSIFKRPLSTKLDAATLDECAGVTCWGRWALFLGLGFRWGVGFG